MVWHWLDSSMSLRKRFENKIIRTATCWLWNASVRKAKDGYGQINATGSPTKKLMAHRVAYELYVGSIPKGMLVLHRCDNPRCVNPEHLFLGTPLDNTTDMIRKGRNASQAGETNGYAKLTWKAIHLIRSDNRLQRVIAAEYGVCQTLIGKIKRGEVWLPAN